MTEPRYGIWIPVYGNWGLLNQPENLFDASYARMRSLLIQAEPVGFSSTFLAQHIINCYDQDFDQLETWTAAALAKPLKKLRLLQQLCPRDN
ncbi:hypothetical protein [Nostoc sp.]|uniref:hypothetical protein n=1 Tax=Nostoc sp. TaxID=1180 RepID=UPI002FF5FC9A